jgi:hypothetical protein
MSVCCGRGQLYPHYCFTIVCAAFTARVTSPGIRLVAVPHHAEKDAPEEAVHEDVLPPLALVLLAGLHAKQVAGRRVVVVFMCVVAGAAGVCGRKLSLLLPAGDDLQAGPRGGDEARRPEERHLGGGEFVAAVAGVGSGVGGDMGVFGRMAVGRCGYGGDAQQL